MDAQTTELGGDANTPTSHGGSEPALSGKNWEATLAKVCSAVVMLKACAKRPLAQCHLSAFPLALCLRCARRVHRQQR